VRLVLVSPSHGGNVGAAARAMRVMGLRTLFVVRPRFPAICAHPDAIAFASGATDVLAAATEVDTLDEALAGVHSAIAVSAESREFSAAPRPPWAVCPEIAAELAADPQRQVALVFGPERTGLSIEHVQRCERVVSIPGEPDYNSLNLAQAVQVLCWELRRAALAGQPAAPPALDPDAGRPASHDQIERFHAHFEQALVAIEFLDPQAPKKLVPRMRRLFARAGLSIEEVDLLRGVCKQILLAADGRLPGRRKRDLP
jgi:tRNA/rRNA methyltransferase